MKVIIDGENLRHQIADVLVKNNKILPKDKNKYFKFDLRDFLEDILSEPELDINYYATKVKQPKHKIPKKLVDRIQMISQSNRQWIAKITNDKIWVIKAGYLRVRESSSCTHCGKKTLVLQEKGVDVRVATDIVLESQGNPGTSLAVACSDSDIVPALQAANSLGGKIIYICYSGRLNRSIAAIADKVVTYDDPSVLRFFEATK
ncbi:hypothetical protein A3F37_01165 [Candidatus Saccharibacteria bacterium RIFCSPHIGHO2_12_FULL_41_12]|nr:MAG: hypothetical protein A3F37_01165 [Candidatus Saccharibacteria bacterium RIFCSPHIGHO2_12_FULL_41_12]